MSGKVKDLSGRIFTRLTVLNLAFMKKGIPFFHCICSCGNYTDVSRVHLVRNRIRSCGCFQKEEHLKADAELKAKEQSVAKLAKAPDKEKLSKVINEMALSFGGLKSEDSKKVANDISAKFESFKKWAIEQINTL